jgi:protein tyrosine/serine phosphatase
MKDWIFSRLGWHNTSALLATHLNTFNMSTQIHRLLLQLLCLSAFAFPALAHAADARNPDWAMAVDTSSNLFRVTPVFYRSAQLAATDVELVKSLGVRTVVNLRKFHKDDALLQGSGIKVKRVGINTWSVADKHVVAALRLIKTAEKDGPVLLHCHHGADRTGLVSAMYRILYQGWSKEQALQEMTQGGYGYHAVWKNIPTYINDVDVEKIRRAVEKS